MGAHSRAGAVITALVQRVIPAEQVHGQSVARVVAVGDWICLAVGFFPFACEFGLVTKKRKNGISQRLRVSLVSEEAVPSPILALNAR